jgi:hypothetical protein
MPDELCRGEEAMTGMNTPAYDQHCDQETTMNEPTRGEPNEIFSLNDIFNEAYKAAVDRLVDLLIKYNAKYGERQAVNVVRQVLGGRQIEDSEPMLVAAIQRLAEARSEVTPDGAERLGRRPNSEVKRVPFPPMVTAFVLVILAVVFFGLGFVFKGLLWLLAIGLVFLVVGAVIGIRTHRRVR